MRKCDNCGTTWEAPVEACPICPSDIAEDVDDMIQTLRNWSNAYPENVFVPFTPEETEKHSMVITRARGAMGRHCGTYMVKAAAMIERLATNTDARILELGMERNELAREVEALRSDTAAPGGQMTAADQKRVADAVVVCACGRTVSEQFALELERLLEAQRELAEANATLSQAMQDRYLALHAQRPSLAAPQWQPIETAPKDGTRILTYGTGHGNHIGSYDTEKNKGEPMYSVAYWGWIDSERDVPVGDGLFRKEPCRELESWRTEWAYRPTHWIPLPEAPK